MSMRLLPRPVLVLLALLSLSCGKSKDQDARPAETRPSNARWQYLDSMLEAECACQDQACREKVEERAEQDGHRYLPAQLLEEDKKQFLALVAKRAPCAAGLQARASQDLVKMQLARIINGSYARWATDPNKICPESFSDLNRYRGDKSIKDPWGHDLLMLCDAARGFGIQSLGPDGKRDTADDIHSWVLSP